MEPFKEVAFPFLMTGIFAAFTGTENSRNANIKNSDKVVIFFLKTISPLQLCRDLSPYTTLLNCNIIFDFFNPNVTKVL